MAFGLTAARRAFSTARKSKQGLNVPVNNPGRLDNAGAFFGRGIGKMFGSFSDMGKGVLAPILGAKRAAATGGLASIAALIGAYFLLRWFGVL